MRHRWTLYYEGKTKMYTLTEWQEAGNEWYCIARLHWSYIEGALEHIRKTETERLKNV